MTDERESNLSEIPTGSAMTDEARESGLRKVATDFAMYVWQAASATYSRRIEELEEQIATARDDALEQAAFEVGCWVFVNVMPDAHNKDCAAKISAMKSQPREAT